VSAEPPPSGATPAPPASPAPPAPPAPPATPATSPAPPRHPLAGLPALLVGVGLLLLFILAGVMLFGDRLRPSPERRLSRQLALLDAPDPGTRQEAVYLLGATEGRELLARSVPALIGALGDEDRNVRDAAATMLRQIARRLPGGGNFPWYDPDAGPEARRAAAKRWREWWGSGAFSAAPAPRR